MRCCEWIVFPDVATMRSTMIALCFPLPNHPNMCCHGISDMHMLPTRMRRAQNQEEAEKYSIDVAMPIGTDVLAIRAGTVVRVEEQFVDGDNEPGHENYVFVQHEDGTAARYVHLTNLGAVVNVNDTVQIGQLVGYSGHTGNSSEPHLHFDVTRVCCVVPPRWTELPFGETIPLSFRNAKPLPGSVGSGKSSCGLQRGIRYEAVAY
jgi:hypothetical protein